MERSRGHPLGSPLMSTDWEARYQRGDTPWNKGAACPGLLHFLAEHPLSGRVLVPGCGLGHDVRAISEQAQEVVGIDIAPSAISAARLLPGHGRERYELADLFDLPPHLRGSFDAAWEHTCFCAIDPALRPAYVEAIAGALKPGGQFLAIFYLDPGMEDPTQGPPFGVTLTELDALFLARFALVREWLPTLAYPGREGREWMRLFSLR